MSESERWVLVPVHPTPEQKAAPGRIIGGDISHECYDKMLAARPPIPPDVFAAMVERGARAWCRAIDANPDEMGYSAAYEGEHPLWQTFIPEATACLRAALGISDE